MSLKPTHRSDTEVQQVHNYAGAVTGGVSDVEEGTRQDEVAVKGGNYNDVQEDAWRDLGTVKEDDGNMGRGLQLTTAVSQQFGDASILKVESQAPLELEYRIMDSTPDQAVGDETVGGELTLDRKYFSTKNPRGACAKILEEEVGQDFGPVNEDDGNMDRGLDLTTEVSQQFGDASILQGEPQAILEMESTNMVSTPDLLVDLSLDGSALPILQQDQAKSDGTFGEELPTDTKGISTNDVPQQLVEGDSQNVPVLLPEEVVLILFEFLKPREILAASQTCQLWRSLGENDKLWEQKCKEAGLAFILTPANQRALERRNEKTTIAYSAWKESFLKPYKISRNFREVVPQVINIEMSVGINNMEIFNDKIVTTFATNLYVFCASSGKLLHKLVGHTGYVAGFQMDDLFIVSASHDGSVKVWDVNTGSCLHTLFGHTGGVTFLQMHGNIAVSGSCDTNTLPVWDVREGICLRTLRHYNDGARRLNERMLEYMNNERVLEYINMMGGHIPMVREDEDSERVRHVQFDGRFVLSGSEEKNIKIWDPKTGECLRMLTHHYSIVFLKLKGDDVVAGYDDGSIKVWEVNTGVCRHTLRVNCSQYMELQGDTLVCRGEDRTTAKIWNLSTGACLHTLNAHRRAISGIGVNDKLVVTSSRDGTVKLWDIKTGEFIRDMLVLESGGSVEKMKMEDAKIVCVVKLNERSKLLVLNFDTIDSTQ